MKTLRLSLCNKQLTTLLSLSFNSFIGDNFYYHQILKLKYLKDFESYLKLIYTKVWMAIWVNLEQKYSKRGQEGIQCLVEQDVQR